MPGAVHDIGNAFALFWPDVHPCGRLREEPWLVLTVDGDTRWERFVRPGARYIGMMPGMCHDEDPPSSVAMHAPTLQVMLPSGGIIGAVMVEPKPISRGSWLNEPRYHRFVEAYRYATSHFSAHAEAFAKLTPEEVHSIVTCISRGFDAVSRSAEVTSPQVTG